MVPYDSVAHWSYQKNLPSEFISYNSLHIWGHRQAGRDMLLDPGGMPVLFKADHLWFEFNINLMAKYIFTHHRPMRPYVIHQLLHLVSDMNSSTFQILYGNLYDYCKILPIRYLTDFKDRDNQVEWYRQRSVDEMGEVVQDLINLSDWISNTIPRGRLALTSDMRRHVLDGAFDYELSAPEAPLSSLYLSTLKSKLARL